MEVMKHFYSHQANKDFAAIDKILGEININRCDDVIIISLLRCNFAVRSELKQWNRLLHKATKKYQGSDKEKLLKGLKEE
jgi:FMN-dependent NADH-azoreductase